ncbi:hypothetical protein [Telluribacter sp. SYSU D00476]|uniref:hypothetical protein n=1 Tax=Telluribacter sp. SYSU D00476 TaxID=2811430 RepID=UPI001FF692AE|nr:hypothetical protein [Telluribacter sp. SYSU D00476]
MKKLFLVLALLFNSYWGICQMSTHSVKAGVSYVQFGSGDLVGFNYYNEYNQSITPYMTIAPSLHVGYGSRDEGYARFTKASISLDPNFFVSPMRFDRSKIRLGIGPSLRYTSSSLPTSYGYSLVGPIPDRPTDQATYAIDLNYTRPMNYWAMGYTVALEGEVTLDRGWSTGIRASFQNYTSGGMVANIGLNVGYQF